MAKIVCGVCKMIHETDKGHCPVCGPDAQLTYDFRNSDEYLESEVPRVLRERDRAIIEFMELTNYTFDFAVYVKIFNSITNVARLAPDEFAMVFTSTEPSEYTLIVNEYIHRYHGFTGFFTRDNVTLLTGSTAKQ